MATTTVNRNCPPNLPTIETIISKLETITVNRQNFQICKSNNKSKYTDAINFERTIVGELKAQIVKWEHVLTRLEFNCWMASVTFRNGNRKSEIGTKNLEKLANTTVNRNCQQIGQSWARSKLTNATAFRTRQIGGL